jgi:PAP2 superfamily
VTLFPRPHVAWVARAVHVPAAVRELTFLAVLYVGYTVARSRATSGPPAALANARALLRTERDWHLAPEQWLNRTVSNHRLAGLLADYDYATLHYIVTPVVLLWLWRVHPDVYARRRRALVTATVLGLVGFVFYPLAPPRMLPGFVDTMARYSSAGWWGTAASAPRGLGSLTDQFAAMPSLHVGWAVWCGWVLVAHAGRRWVRGLGVAYPFTTLFVVLSTGNHYLADAVGGLAVVLIGFALAGPFGRVVPALRAATRSAPAF